MNAQIAFLADILFEQILERKDLFGTEGHRDLEQNNPQAIKAGRDMFDNDIEKLVKPEFYKIMDKTRLSFLKKDRTLELFSKRDLSEILNLFDDIMRKNIDMDKIQQEINGKFDAIQDRFSNILSSS